MSISRLLWLAAVCLACFTASLNAEPRVIREGVVKDPERPVITNVDFDQRLRKRDATGSTQWKKERLMPGEGTIRFNVTVNGRPFQYTGHADAKRIVGEM